MNRYIVGLALILGIGYWCYTWWQDDVAKTEARSARAARQQAQKQSIDDLARKANAIADWPATLAGSKQIRLGQIMTAELQKLWLGDRPILFVGNVTDVAINKDGTYQVTLEYNWIGTQYTFVSSEIRISITCPESFGTKLIDRIKTDKLHGIGADTAVVAIIERIEKSTEKGEEGSSVDVLSGIGKYVDSMPLTELPLKNSKN